MRRFAFTTGPVQTDVTDDVNLEEFGGRERVVGGGRSRLDQRRRRTTNRVAEVLDTQDNAGSREEQMRRQALIQAETVLIKAKLEKIMLRYAEVFDLEKKGRYDEALALSVRLKYEYVIWFLDYVELSGKKVDGHREALSRVSDDIEAGFDDPMLGPLADQAHEAMLWARKLYDQDHSVKERQAS